MRKDGAVLIVGILVIVLLSILYLEIRKVTGSPFSINILQVIIGIGIIVGAILLLKYSRDRSSSMGVV